MVKIWLACLIKQQSGENQVIVHSLETLALFGGVEPSADIMTRARAMSTRVVAADGGANWAVERGIVPDAVIGDLDSISDKARAAIGAERLHFVDDQDTTDFEKCLAGISAPLIIGAGFVGARQDHQLACYNALVRAPQQRCVLLSDEELVFLAPPSLRLPLATGARVSLFPFGAVEGISDGLVWEIAGLNFAPDGRIGTSNAAKGPVQLRFTAPKMLVVLPVETLSVVVDALLGTAARWE